jgi:hypothetical protein
MIVMVSPLEKGLAIAWITTMRNLQHMRIARPQLLQMPNSVSMLAMQVALCLNLTVTLEEGPSRLVSLMVKNPPWWIANSFSQIKPLRRILRRIIVRIIALEKPKTIQFDWILNRASYPQAKMVRMLMELMLVVVVLPPLLQLIRCSLIRLTY